MSDFISGPLTDPLTQRLTPASAGLIDAATIAVDLSKGDVFNVTLGGNRTVGAPTNIKGGQRFSLVVTQDAVGSRTLAFNAAFVFDRTPTLNSTAASVTVFDFITTSDGKHRCIAVSSSVGSTSAIASGSITITGGTATGTATVGTAYNGKPVVVTLKTPSAALHATLVPVFAGVVAAGVLTITSVAKDGTALNLANDQVFYYMIDGR